MRLRCRSNLLEIDEEAHRHYVGKNCRSKFAIVSRLFQSNGAGGKMRLSCCVVERLWSIDEVPCESGSRLTVCCRKELCDKILCGLFRKARTF